MEGLEPFGDQDDVVDVFIDRQPMRITQAPAYFRLKNIAAWSALREDKGRLSKVRLRPGDDWDSLGDRLSKRWQVHVWHPSHWDSYYATLPDVPASVLAAREWLQALYAPLAENEEGQYKLFLDNS